MPKKPIIQKIVLGAVIFKKNDKILILQRCNSEDIFPGMWELPSGKREFLETSQDSLAREVKEETGLNIEVVMPCSVFEYQIEKPKEVKDSTQINFIVKTKTVKVKLSSEHQNHAWISESELEDYELSQKTKKGIKEAFRIYQKVS